MGNFQPRYRNRFWNKKIFHDYKENKTKKETIDRIEITNLKSKITSYGGNKNGHH